MRKRSGVALLAVMLFCFAAALVGTETFLLLEWAHASGASSRWRFAGRVQLASMVEVGRRWLREELKTGRVEMMLMLGRIFFTGWLRLGKGR